jgi:hypothetical protein
MTKSELLVDLLGRDGIAALVGDPVVVTPSGDEGVVAWYDQAVWEIRGVVALKKSIRFYVLDEGGPAEAAYYKDAEPQSSPDVRENALHSWMRSAIDANPDDYQAAQIHYVSERWEMVVYSILEDDTASGLMWVTYYIRKGGGGAVKISNHDPSFLRSLFQV